MKSKTILSNFINRRFKGRVKVFDNSNVICLSEDPTTTYQLSCNTNYETHGFHNIEADLRNVDKQVHDWLMRVDNDYAVKYTTATLVNNEPTASTLQQAILISSVFVCLSWIVLVGVKLVAFVAN